MPTSAEIYDNQACPTLRPSGSMYDHSWLTLGHFYRWVAPPDHRLPSASHSMQQIYDHPIVQYTYRRLDGAVRLEPILSEWFWGHLKTYFIDLGIGNSDASIPTDPPKKGETITIRVPGFAKPIHVTVMDNRTKAPVRLVMVDGQSAMVTSYLLNRR